MPTTTGKGRELRDELNQALKPTGIHIELSYLPTLSLLRRRAARHAKMQEDACNYEWACGDQWDKKEERLEQSIRDLAQTLPGVDGVKFTGDPRGYTVRLLLAGQAYNTWGGKEDGWGIA